MINGRRRILFVSHTAEITGPTNSLMALLPYLKGRYDLAVLAPEEGPLMDWLEDHAIPAHVISEKRSIGTRNMLALLKREKYHLIYGNNPGTYTRNALIAARLTKLPSIWHFRSIKWHWDWREGIFLRLANRVIAVSQACAEPLTRFISPNKIRVIYNGVETGAYQVDRAEARQYLLRQAGLPPDAKILISVGHLMVRKGQVDQVEVMRQLAGKRPDVYLLLAGNLTREPDYVDQVRRFIAKHHLEDRVIILGFRGDVPKLLAGADLYIHTPRSDAHPRAVIEAMAAGLPVAAYAVDGVRETVVDGQTGSLVRPGDCAAMVRAVEALLDVPQLQAAYGEQGRKRVLQCYTASGTAAYIDQVLQEVLKESREKTL